MVSRSYTALDPRLMGVTRLLGLCFSVPKGVTVPPSLKNVRNLSLVIDHHASFLHF